MKPKPAHLQPVYGSQFGDSAVVATYGQRPPYADAAIGALAALVAPGGKRVLDVGCGRGDLAVPLAARRLDVDAVDPSEAMLCSGRARPGGKAPGLSWIQGGIEDAPLRGPYHLATAGQSLHWTDWEVSLPRIASVLAPGAVLALLDREIGAPPWQDALTALVAHHSTNQEFQPYVLVDELTSRNLFVEAGRMTTESAPFFQSCADYVESFHSRNGFSRERMTVDSARAFDDAVADLVRSHLGDEPVELSVSSSIVWGKPTGG